MVMISFNLLAYSISFDREFITQIKPDTLKASISFTTLKRSEKDVLEKLTHFSTFIDNYQEVDKKGGNYHINPEYKYENNHRYKIGYRGRISYQISSKSSNDLNAFIYKVQNQKSDKDDDISISNVSWVLSPTQKDGKLDALRLVAIKWINSYTKELSLDLNSTCSISKIIFNQNNIIKPSPMIKTMSVRVDNAPTPQKDILKIILNPHFEIECK